MVAIDQEHPLRLMRGVDLRRLARRHEKIAAEYGTDAPRHHRIARAMRAELRARTRYATAALKRVDIEAAGWELIRHGGAAHAAVA